MTNSHKNIINPFLESSTLLIMTFPEIVESKDLLWGRTCAVDNVRARRKGVLGKLYEMQISPERGLRNSLNFPSHFGMEYVRPWNVGKKLLESLGNRVQFFEHRNGTSTICRSCVTEMDFHSYVSLVEGASGSCFFGLMRFTKPNRLPCSTTEWADQTDVQPIHHLLTRVGLTLVV